MAQIVVHSAIIGDAILVLPVLPNESWQSQDVLDPNIEILGMLEASVALPFMALASNRPTRASMVCQRLSGPVALPATHAKIAFPHQEDLSDVALWTDDYSDLFGALK